MKAQLFDSKGNKKSQLELPALFDSKIREDLALKYFEAEKEHQPYAPGVEAGKRHSASGTIGHRRHQWGGHYGKGISRVPRKTMWRRGTQFYWIGAEVSGTRGGRRAHPPRVIRRVKKINKNEMLLAMNSAFAATANKNLVIRRYASLDSIETLPAVIESLPSKTKELISALKNIFGGAFALALKNKSVRAGRGKSRSRKYKSNAGILIVKGKEEPQKFSGIDVKSAKDVEISDLYPLGRIVLYTKKAVEELSGAGKK